MVAVSASHGIAAHGEEAGKGGQGEQVAGVSEGGDGWNGAHGILCTQLGGTQQQPHIQHTQIAPVKLAQWSWKHHGWIIETAENIITYTTTDSLGHVIVIL